MAQRHLSSTHSATGSLMDRTASIQPRRAFVHAAIALALMLVTLALLYATEPQIGLTWDEPAYIIAAKSYVAWFQRLAVTGDEVLRPDVITRYWEWNHEHPPLDKIWSGLVWAAVHPYLDDLAAHRLGNMVLVAFGLGGLYYTVARGFGIWAGLAASLALIGLPRFFFHAHLAALDVPAAVSVFLLTALFWHTRDRRSFAWDLALGLAWGMALAVKINALFVLPTCFLWMAIFERRWFLLRRLAVAGVFGPLAFVGLWPWLYHDTLERLLAYLRFITVDHWEIGQWYFGAWHMPPPWHFAFVMLAAVTPLALLLLALVGMVYGAWALRSANDSARTQGSQIALWVLSAVIPLLALAIGRTMVYDNERLFMPAFIFIAALAGVGLAALAGALRSIVARKSHPRLGAPAAALLAMALFLPHLAAGFVLYPHLLSYYSETVGGLRGATRLGLETTYWCETYAEAIPYINAHAAPDSVIWVEDWSHDVMLYYQFTGRLRPDVRIAMAQGAGSLFGAYGLEGVRADITDADYVIVAYRQTGFAVHPEIERWMRGRTPVLRVERDGIPLMALYQR